MVLYQDGGGRPPPGMTRLGRASWRSQKGGSSPKKLSPPRQVKYSSKAQPGSHQTLSGSGLVESECYDQDFAHPNRGVGRLVPNCRDYGVGGMHR